MNFRKGGMSTKRLSKEERRRQLLGTALKIVREEGVEALTLAVLAERAGVTKPIAYEHFGTRAGLLMALFKDHDDRTTEAVNAALSRAPGSIEEVAQIVSAAYVDCVCAIGPEFGALLHALAVSEETTDFPRTWRGFLITEFRSAFAPFVKLPKKSGDALLLGVLGAAEALSDAAAHGRVSRNDAVAALSKLLLGAVKA